MKFDTFLNQAWDKHGSDLEEVLHTLPRALDLVETNDQIPALARLVTHVYGDHLGQWDEGTIFLKRLKTLPGFIDGTESEKAIERSLAVLELAGGNEKVLSKFSDSETTRIVAMAAAALCEREVIRASLLYRRALEGAEQLLPTDPANRAIAVTSNNLACSLEEKATRNVGETELMVLAAQTARKYWEIAGGPTEICFAEYRLAMTFTKAGRPEEAAMHATLAIAISESSDGESILDSPSRQLMSEICSGKMK